MPSPGRSRRLTPGSATATVRDPSRRNCSAKMGSVYRCCWGTAKLAEQECQLSFVIDISGQKRAETSLRILSERSKALLGASLDYEALFKSIAWLVVPRFADWCAVESVDEGCSLGRHVALENLS